MSQDTAKSPGLSLGRIGGVPIYLAYSWFAITAVIVLLFGRQLQTTQGMEPSAAYPLAFVCALMIALAVLLHELGHALTARYFKWPDAHIVLTLWGGHTQFGSFNAKPGSSLAVALAGPLTNFVLAGLGWAAMQLQMHPYLLLVLTFSVYANVLLGAFNALPGLPLDGGRLVESAVWKATGSQDRGTIAASWVGRVIAVTLVIWFAVLPLLRGQSPDFTMIIVGALVAAFMWQATTALIGQSKIRLRLPRVKAAQLMHPASAMTASSTVAQVRERRALRAGAVILVDGRGMPSGVVDENALAQVSAADAPTTTASAVARALGEGAIVAEDADGKVLIGYLAQIPTAEYAVINAAGRVVGLLMQQDIIQAVNPHGHR